MLIIEERALRSLSADSLDGESTQSKGDGAREQGRLRSTLAALDLDSTGAGV